MTSPAAVTAAMIERFGLDGARAAVVKAARQTFANGATCLVIPEPLYDLLEDADYGDGDVLIDTGAGALCAERAATFWLDPQGNVVMCLLPAGHRDSGEPCGFENGEASLEASKAQGHSDLRFRSRALAWADHREPHELRALSPTPTPYEDITDL